MSKIHLGNIKGEKGDKGDAGTNAYITGATASVDNTTGTPAVTVTMGGTESNRSFDFAFSGLKGEVGAEGKTTSIDINKLTPTYTEASSLATTESGEALSVAFGKIKKAISSLISHLSDTTKHITAAERTSWSGGSYTLLKEYLYNVPAVRTETISSTGQRFPTQITGVDFGAYDELLFVLNGTITIPASASVKTAYNNIFAYITSNTESDGVVFAGLKQANNKSGYTLSLNNTHIRMFKSNYSEVNIAANEPTILTNKTKSAFDPESNSATAFSDTIYIGLRVLNENTANYTVTPNITVKIYGKNII